MSPDFAARWRQQKLEDINGQVKADAHLVELSRSSEATLILQVATPGIDQALQSLDNVQTVEAVSSLKGYSSYRLRLKQFPSEHLGCFIIYRSRSRN